MVSEPVRDAVSDPSSSTRSFEMELHSDGGDSLGMMRTYLRFVGVLGGIASSCVGWCSAVDEFGMARTLNNSMLAVKAARE